MIKLEKKEFDIKEISLVKLLIESKGDVDYKNKQHSLMLYDNRSSPIRVSYVTLLYHHIPEVTTVGRGEEEMHTEVFISTSAAARDMVTHSPRNLDLNWWQHVDLYETARELGWNVSKISINKNGDLFSEAEWKESEE